MARALVAWVSWRTRRVIGETDFGIDKLKIAMQLNRKQHQSIVQNGLKTMASFSVEKKAEEYLERLKKLLV